MKLQQQFLNQIKEIVSNARQRAIQSVNTERVLMYWQIGKLIFEEEQKGKDRATYGTFLIKSIETELKPVFGTVFSSRQLYRCVQFYKVFPIVSALRTQFHWSHYKSLISISDKNKREYYIAEASKNNWSARQLERQINSQLFERLLLSNQVEDVLAVARQEKEPENPLEIIKDPMFLEFLDLRRETSYYEKDFETAIITHLQEFILELGNGFSFVARQKRIHIDGDEFFIDLVFYNRLLQCFVVIELKNKKITHQDLGQLQMYVNYYDRFEKQESENPTIGILLCTDKNDAMVKISLPKENKTIIASKYKLYLPSEKQLIDEVLKEVKRIDTEK